MASLFDLFASFCQNYHLRERRLEIQILSCMELSLFHYFGCPPEIIYCDFTNNLLMTVSSLAGGDGINCP